MYRDEWAEQRAVGVRLGEFVECWGIDRSTHARWLQPADAKKREHARRIGEAVIQQVVTMDRQYRSTWDARAIAHEVKISPTTVQSILLEVRGPRPRPVEVPHTCRTAFLRRDVMWSSDFWDKLPGGRHLITTLDEMSDYRVGWEGPVAETAEVVVRHAEGCIRRMEQAPLVWKYDHGTQFTSKRFQQLLADYRIVAYPIPCRSPWVNGRNERDHQEIQRWMIPVPADIMDEALEKEADEGMRMLNFIKPRQCLGYRTSAEVYFTAPGIEDIDREAFIRSIEYLKLDMGGHSGERLHRRAVRLALQQWRLYEEWDVQPREAKFVNRSGGSNVAN